ncbi:MAG: methyltransferase [Chloroflexota bacterium]
MPRLSVDWPARIGAALQALTPKSSLRQSLARRWPALFARTESAALSVGRDLTARSGSARLAQSWLAGAWVTQAISVAARLDLADRLASGPKTSEQLAAEVGAHAPSLYRLLRMLASLGLFAEDETGRFTTTRFGRCLERDGPDSVHAIALMVGSRWHWEAWGQLSHTIMTGESAFQHALGAEPYIYFQQHPEDGRVFSTHMEAYARQAAVAAASYDFANAQTVVDVGGGYGAVISAVLKANPTLRGILTDLPDVVEGARPLLAAAGLDERCETVPGSFFEDVPSGGDVYLLSSILHNWSDEEAVSILKTCRRAMTGASRLVVVELMVPPGNAPGDAKLLDMQMMVLFQGGRERTTDEYRALLQAGGFRLTRTLQTPNQMYLIEAVPV